MIQTIILLVTLALTCAGLFHIAGDNRRLRLELDDVRRTLSQERIELQEKHDAAMSADQRLAQAQRELTALREFYTTTEES
jgi:hypothetical protein